MGILRGAIMGEIKTKKFKDKYAKIKADKLKVCKEFKCVYDFVNEEIEFDITTKDGDGWFFVHDYVTAFLVAEGTLTTETVSTHAMEGYDTDQECLDRIIALGLSYDPLILLSASLSAENVKKVK